MSISEAITIGVPEIGLGSKLEINSQYEAENDFTFGEDQTFTLGTLSSTVVSIAPCREFHLSEMFKQAQLNIPYHTRITYENDVVVEHDGYYSGVTTSQEYTTAESFVIEDCQVELEKLEAHQNEL